MNENIMNQLKKRCVIIRALALVLVGGLITVAVPQDIKVQAAEKTIYYLEDPEDELIAVERAIANRETSITYRYLSSRMNDFEGYIAGDYVDTYYETFVYNNMSSNSLVAATVNNSDFEPISAKGQKWDEVTTKIKYWDSSTDYDKTIAGIRKLIKDSGIATKYDIERAKWAYDWVSSNVKYEMGPTDGFAPAAFITKKAACQGYASLYALFARELGLDSKIVKSGIARGGNGWEGHSWNLVEIDGKWYQVDTTWGAAWGDKYFMKGSTSFDEDHSMSNYIEDSGMKLSEKDYTGGSIQKGGVKATVYGAKFDLVANERLNLGEEYQWLLSNPDGIKFTYTNNSPSVVSLDSKGKITALAKGNATLTATNKELGIREIITIKVLKEKATVKDYVTIKSAKNVTVNYGKTATISLTLSNSKGKLTNPTYTSANKKIATVDKNGKVTGVSAGSTTITIKYTGGETVKVKVVVKPIVKKTNSK